MRSRTDMQDGQGPRVDAPPYAEMRQEAFGEDLGQTGWITAAECDAFLDWLGVGRGGRVLEVACGSGGVSLRLAGRGPEVIGIDIDEAAIAAAARRARESGDGQRASFRVASADEPLPYPDGSFDGVLCCDAIHRFRDRDGVLAAWHRALRPGGRCVYTDPVVLTGCLTGDETAERSSNGRFALTPPGANEESLRAAGFRLVRTENLTEGLARTSRRWREARERRREALVEVEGEVRFEEMQGFLGMVHRLSGEGRLSRFAYLGEKPA